MEVEVQRLHSGRKIFSLLVLSFLSSTGNLMEPTILQWKPTGKNSTGEEGDLLDSFTNAQAPNLFFN
tara:strand:+ start:1398 stop:1598 length:201 start_codon:yes stop_codon:yes gene_type:complete